MTEKASQEFWDAFQCGGSPTFTCVCGRFHFATGHYNDNGEDEVEELRDKAREYPDKYFETSDDSVCSMSLAGGIAYGCPCGMSKKYENFLDINRDDIISYYRKKVESEKKRTESLAQGVEGL